MIPMNSGDLTRVQMLSFRVQKCMSAILFFIEKNVTRNGMRLDSHEMLGNRNFLGNSCSLTGESIV